MILRARLLLLATALPFVAGCGAYLHRPELETSTAAIKTSFGALSAPAYLEQQQQRLNAFASQEDRAVAELHVASRDYSMINILDPQPPLARRASLLRDQIGQRLTRVIGAPAVQNASLFARLRFDRAQATQVMAAVAGRMERAKRNYRAAGGSSTELGCAEILRAPQPPGADPQLARTRYGILVTMCQNQATAEARAMPCDTTIAGRIGEVCAELVTLRATQGISQSQRERFMRAKSALQEHLTQLTRNRPSAADQFRDLVEKAGETPDIEDYRKLLEIFDDIFEADLTASIAELTQARDSALSHPAVESTYAALRALQAVSDLDSQPAALEQPSALLIGLAKIRHDLAILDIDLETGRRRIALKEAEVEALLTQAHYLARAQDTLCRSNGNCLPTEHDLALALSHYVSSFDRGLIPFEVLAARELQARRTAAVRRAQATEADYRALLQPAIDQLAAYGAGGVQAEVLGQFLANVPVAGAILGR